MANGLYYGKLGLGVRCAEFLGMCMTLHRRLFYWREKNLYRPGGGTGRSMFSILFSIRYLMRLRKLGLV